MPVNDTKTQKEKKKPYNSSGRWRLMYILQIIIGTYGYYYYYVNNIFYTVIIYYIE